ncbi:MAG: ATP-dependent 6-phosphofructokinase, partial [Erysipelatoclostridium sp.]|nr:ATP-dependent 6-phosphofructokinase [Thomasclavelia sp.]
VTIGGDGTYQGALALSRRGINCIGLPGTIDNDIASTDYTIGFDTALNCIIECVDRLRDTSTSHQRCSVIEVMGRHCPDLAAYAGVACGAEITITQESEWTKESVIAELKKQKESGKRHAIVIVAEHICDVHEFAHEIERDSGFETKAEVLGHMQRGGSPTAFDRVLASRMGDYAVDLLINGVSGACVGIVKNELKYYPIEEALKLPRHSCKDLLKVGARLE